MGAWLQQVALIYTKVANVAFLTALYVLIVPLLLFFIFGKKLSLYLVFAIILCVIGTWVLLGEETELGYWGDLLAIIGAVFWAFHIILISKAGALNLEPSMTAAVHIIFAGILGLISAFLFENPSITDISGGIIELIYTGCISVGIGFTIQTVAQVKVPAARASIILSMETVFAAIAAYIVLGQILGYYSIMGCLLIISGVLIAELSKSLQKF